MSLTLKVKGLDSLIADFDKLATKAKDGTNKALDAFGQAVVRDAKGLVSLNSSDEGKLNNSINSTVGSLNVTITANTNYAAYIEFGTRKFAAAYVSTLPPDWQTFAAEFKGRGGGNFKEFLLSIMGWVKRKGIDNKAAYPIAMKILRNGIRAKPYLYPSINKNIKQLETDIENVINERF